MGTKINAVISLKSQLKAVQQQDGKNGVERCQVATELQELHQTIFLTTQPII